MFEFSSFVFSQQCAVILWPLSFSQYLFMKVSYLICHFSSTISLCSFDDFQSSFIYFLLCLKSETIFLLPDSFTSFSSFFSSFTSCSSSFSEMSDFTSFCCSSSFCLLTTVSEVEKPFNIPYILFMFIFGSILL